MNQPAPRELCEKLEAMGCVSESGLVRTCLGIISAAVPTDPQGIVQLFVQNDFTGATEQADKNSKIVWSDCDADDSEFEGELYTNHGTEAYLFYRMRMIQVWPKETWWQYLERTMVKK